MPGSVAGGIASPHLKTTHPPEAFGNSISESSGPRRRRSSDPAHASPPPLPSPSPPSDSSGQPRSFGNSSTPRRPGLRVSPDRRERSGGELASVRRPSRPAGTTADAAHALAKGSADRPLTPLLYASRKATSRSREVAFDLRGRYWDRTSDLFGVKQDAAPTLTCNNENLQVIVGAVERRSVRLAAVQCRSLHPSAPSLLPQSPGSGPRASCRRSRSISRRTVPGLILDARCRVLSCGAVAASIAPGPSAPRPLPPGNGQPGAPA
ncbi:hypothetical protein J3R08_001920 [Micromonospora sp. HB375]|nr:hypothetical protein [Micromonospora sp. HB375]MDH6470854.1 hypothetical protein [Micromonospora sp. H404/HB375]